MTAQTTPPDLLLGLIGDNIAASSAPRLHRLAGAQAGLAVRYDRLVPAEQGLGFDALFEACPGRGYRALNITYPYKERAAARVRIADPMVAAMGAVNTVLFGPDGTARGYNTDHSGFVAALRAARGDAPPGSVLMIGTGGVGRAVAFGLAALGTRELRLCDRDGAKARALASDLAKAAPGLAVCVHDTAAKGAQGAEGLINCTPVGMIGYEGTPLPADAMAGATWAFDAVYTPVETQFLNDAAARGLQVISGWELFFHQGLDAWRLFSNREADAPALRAALHAGHDVPEA